MKKIIVELDSEKNVIGTNENLTSQELVTAWIFLTKRILENSKQKENSKKYLIDAVKICSEVQNVPGKL